MQEPPTTRPSLLVRIRDAWDQEAWERFVEIYAPLVYGFLRRHRLQDADAADVTQEVLRAVARAIRKLDYDRHRGSFRGWLFTVVRSKLRTYLKRERRACVGSGDTGDLSRLNEQPAPEENAEDWWDREYERRHFLWAADRVRKHFQDSTWKAFWLTAVEGKAGKEVAASLGLSVAAVYLAKSRVMARLKKELDQFREQ